MWVELAGLTWYTENDGTKDGDTSHSKHHEPNQLRIGAVVNIHKLLVTYSEFEVVWSKIRFE